MTTTTVKRNYGTASIYKWGEGAETRITEAQITFEDGTSITGNMIQRRMSSEYETWENICLDFSEYCSMAVYPAAFDDKQIQREMKKWLRPAPEPVTTVYPDQVTN